MCEIETPDDLGGAIDHSERKLANARRVRDDAMQKIEASRRGVHKLNPDDYSDQKARHGNAEYAVAYWSQTLRAYSGWYNGRLSCEWMREDEPPECKPSLTQVWRLWRDVLDARKVYADLAVIVPQPDAPYYANAYGRDVPVVYVGTALQRLDAEVALDRASGLYDTALRAFEGRAPHTHEQRLNITWLVRKPSRKLPPKRVAVTPIKYVRDERGVRVPRR